MRKSGYRSIFHIYLIFFLAFLGAACVSVIFFFSVITVRLPDGSFKRSDNPKVFTEHFKEQIILIDGKPGIKQDGMELLQANQAGIQILDEDGMEAASYAKPENERSSFSNSDLLEIYQSGQSQDTGMTAFAGTFSNEEKDYVYIVYFPLDISKVTMYLNGSTFTTGKTAVVMCAGVLLFIVLAGGIVYGVWMTGKLKLISTAVSAIAGREYEPLDAGGTFGDVAESLNSLAEDIKESDRMRLQTEKMREEWIANITHDLKTPLSPIRGYAEILSETNIQNESQLQRYAKVILKNVSSIEQLIEDLKLTYQLENAMIPIQKERLDIVRFLKELIIDILNNPSYENREIFFECEEETIPFEFDQKLMARAFQNLVINAFSHGNDNTAVVISIKTSGHMLSITVSDDGNGMPPEELSRLFQRYYRGTGTDKNTAGTGLGLAISKSIIEAQGGTIKVDSEINKGTSFRIHFEAPDKALKEEAK